MDEDPITARVLIEESEEDALQSCARCGQRFDNRDLMQILYHRTPEHEPLAAR